VSEYIKKIIVIMGVVLILATAGAVSWLFVSGKLTFADQNAKLAPTEVICDTVIVNTFNDAMFYTRRAGASTVSIDKESIKNLNSEIKAEAGYENDPTCQTIIYLTAIYEEDYDGAKSAYEALKKLHDKNIFASNNIRGNQPLFTYEGSMYPFSPEGKTQGGLGG
jgi:hypothetical protein